MFGDLDNFGEYTKKYTGTYAHLLVSFYLSHLLALLCKIYELENQGTTVALHPPNEEFYLTYTTE